MTECRKIGKFQYDFVKLPPDWQIGLHSQKSWELDYILAGRGIRTIGNRTESFREGEIVLIPPEIPHCWDFDPDFTDSGGDIVNITLIFDDLLLDSILKVFPDMQTCIVRILDRRDTAISYSGSTLERLASVMSAMKDEDASERPASFLKILNILGDASLAGQSGICRKMSPDEKRKMKVRTFVSCNCLRAVTLEEVASYVGMNESAFCVFFKKNYGQTFVEYLNAQRLEHARYLLENGSLSVAEVCYACGFSSPPYFSRLFRRGVGMSPLQYAKLNQKI